MDTNTYTVSLEIIFSCIAMIIGVGTFLASKSKEGDTKGRQSATVEVKLDFILDTLNELKGQIDTMRIEDEDNKSKIISIEKEMIMQEMRLNFIEEKLNIHSGDENNHE